jgi:hypothetical protein
MQFKFAKRLDTVNQLPVPTSPDSMEMPVTDSVAVADASEKPVIQGFYGYLRRATWLGPVGSP